MKKLGFTLIELSIVIVIIALIIGGVFVGKSLIDGAELNAVIADEARYKQAAMNYRDQYKALPGDHANATSITSEVPGSVCPTPAASDEVTTPTCNGTGDGFIGDAAGNPLGAQANSYESLLFWQHLSNAGLLNEQYSGHLSTSGTGITLSINSPISEIPGASFGLRYFPIDSVAPTNYFKADYGHVFFFGRPGANSSLPYITPILTGKQAWQIDSKIDDGRPGSGSVMSLTNTSAPNCVSTDVVATATYLAASNEPTAVCPLIFITGF